jgi:hypothetical protein
MDDDGPTTTAKELAALEGRVVINPPLSLSFTDRT